MVTFPLDPARAARLLLTASKMAVLGGPGSGNFGHAGRPGEVGGSAPAEGSVNELTDSAQHPIYNEISKVQEEFHKHIEKVTGTPRKQQIANVSTPQERSAIKAHLVNNLTSRVSADLKMDPEDVKWRVQEIVDVWAGTSAGEDPRAIHMQHLVADEFKVQEAATDHLAQPEKPANRDEAFDRAYLRAEYAATQEWFKERGITHVSLYRGMDDDAGIEEDEDGEFDSRQTVYMQPASSWSTSEDVAKSFATQGGPLASGWVLETRVPVSRVLSTAATGRGSMLEEEIILLGGKMRVNVDRYWEEKDDSDEFWGTDY